MIFPVPLAAVLSAVVFTGPAARLPQQSPDVTFVVAMPAASPEPVVVWRQAPGGAAARIDIRTSPGSQPGTLNVSAPCVPGDYVVQTTTRVSWIVRLEADRCGRALEVALLPAASIRGRVVLPTERTSAPPAAASPAQPASTITVPVYTCPETTRGDEIGQYRLRLGQQGEFSAVVPAGCVEFGLRVEAFAPIPRARVTLKPGELRELGKVELKPGATLVVFVRSHGQPIPGATVWAVAAEKYNAVIGLFARNLDVPEMSATADRSGVAALVGVPPTIVHLLGRTNERAGIAAPLEVTSGQEVEAVVDLFGPALVEVLVGDDEAAPNPAYVQAAPLGASLATTVPLGTPDAPASSASFRLPTGGRWSFELRSLSIQPPRQAPSVDGQSVGGYGVSTGLLDRQEADVVPETSQTVWLQPGRLRFRGRVLLGDEPVSGSLELMRPGTQDVVARVTTEADGRFVAGLPGPGVYSAAFSNGQDGQRNAQASAEFALDQETLVRLIASRVDGSVAFADGRGARTAVVSAERVSDEPMAFGEVAATATCDARGRFTLLALQPGSYDVSARLGARKSESRRVIVGETDTPPVQLVLSDIDGLVVQVPKADGVLLPPVTGWFMASASEYGAIPQATTFQTDAEGIAKVGLWWGPGSRAQIVLTDANQPVTALRVVPGEDGVVGVTLPRGSGQLTVTLPSNDRSSADANRIALLSDQGGLVPLSLLMEMGLTTQAPAGDASKVIIPALASGRWQVVRFADVRALFQFYNGASSPDVVASFSLAPGGSAGIDVR